MPLLHLPAHLSLSTRKAETAEPQDRGEDAASSGGSGVLGEGAKVGLWRPPLKQEAGRAGPDTGRIADYAAPQGAPRTHTQPPAEVVRGHVLR